MPITLSAEQFAQKYGNAGSAPQTLSADEFQKRYGHVGTRPTAAPVDDSGPGPVRRFLQGAGVPTSMDEVRQMGDALDPSVQIMRGNPAALAGPVGLAAQGLMRTVGGGIGTQAGEALDAAQQGDYQGAMKHTLGAAVPLVGPQAAEGNLAGAAGTVASLVLPTMAGKATGRILEGMGTAQKAPLTETLGSQIAAKGGKVFSPSEPVTVPKFKSAAAQQSQLEALAEKYPNSTVYDEGDSFRVEANKPQAKVPSAMDRLADTASRVARPAIGGAVGGAIGSIFGEPALGAKIGVGAVEGANALKAMVNSPLWRTVSGSIKQAVGKAMQAQDFGTVAATASRVLGGQGLDDQFGHDAAIHSLMNDIAAQQPNGSQPDAQTLHQLLQEYDAIYVGPDGIPVLVPHNIQQQTVRQLSGH